MIFTSPHFPVLLTSLVIYTRIVGSCPYAVAQNGIRENT